MVMFLHSPDERGMFVFSVMASGLYLLASLNTRIDNPMHLVHTDDWSIDTDVCNWKTRIHWTNINHSTIQHQQNVNMQNCVASIHHLRACMQTEECNDKTKPVTSNKEEFIY